MTIQVTLYDKYAFVKPINVVYAFRRATELEKADYRVQYWECVQTGNSDIDSIATEQAYTLTLDLVNLSQPNTAITYIPGETVYQGPADEPTASGIVTLYTGDANGGSLLVTSIAGTFSANGGLVVGANSATSATLSDTPDTRISSVAPDSDNVFVSDEAESVIVVRGTNPRTTQ